jgi:small subunit ribosomal protein S2
MRPFIVVNNKSRGNTIDLVKTLFYLSSAYSFIKSVAQDGGRILFVGTGKQAIKEHIEEEAKRTKALYITQR